MSTKTEVLTLQISCIRKSDRYNPWERITHVGGVHDGRRWMATQENAIRNIENGRAKYWTVVNKKSVWVTVGESRFGNKYLKTEADGAEENNLLSLPECP